MTLTVPRRRAAAALAALALFPLAGCGGDDGGGGSSSSGKSPASLLPANSLFSFEGTVAPTGQQRSDLDALIGKFAPGQSLDKLLAMAKDSDGSYEADVKPWLGKEAGVAITSVTAGEDPDYAAVIQSTDDDKALKAVSKNTQDGGEYKGVKIRKDDKTLLAVTDGEVIVGTDAGFKQAIDVLKGAPSLASNPMYTKVRKASTSGLAFLYGDVGKLLDFAGSTITTPTEKAQFDAARELVTQQGISVFGATLVAQGDAVKLDTVAPAAKQSGEGDAAPAVAALPGGALAAFGIGDLGGNLSKVLAGLSGITTDSGMTVGQSLEELKSQTGIDVDKDLLSWMGTAAGFVRGAGIADIGGALVVQSKDPAATRAALAKAKTLAAGAGVSPEDLTGSGIDDGFSFPIQGAPIEVFAALAGDKFVLAANRSSLDAALKPTSKLSDDPAYKAAAASLDNGAALTTFLDFKTVGSFLALAAADNPQYAQAKPYLDQITTIAAGTKREGDLVRQNITIGIR